MIDYIDYMSGGLMGDVTAGLTVLKLYELMGSDFNSVWVED